MKNISFLVAMLFMATNFCFARNYYVSVDGKYANDGLSPTRPFRDPQTAADRTLPGDTVFIMSGTYATPCTGCNVFTIQRSGTPSAYIVYRNYPGHKPKIKFNGWNGISIQDGASYIKVMGLEVEGPNQSITLNEALNQPGGCRDRQGDPNPKYNGNGITITGRWGAMPHHIVISQNAVHDCGGAGIGVMHADYLTIEDNLVYNNSWYTIYATSGISLYQLKNHDSTTSYRNYIRRNKCFQNRLLVPWVYGGCEITDGNGIIIDDLLNTQNGSTLGSYMGRTLVENNIVWYNGGTGIHTFLSEHVDIFNNTAYLNNQSAGINSGQILSNSSNDVRIVNNILYAPTGKVVTSSWNNQGLVYENNLHFNNGGTASMQTNSTTTIVTADPMFMAPGNSLTADFRLKNVSPAIDKGSTVLFSEADILGIDRPTGSFADLGAYEKPGSAAARIGTAEQERNSPDESSIQIYPNPLRAQSNLRVRSEQEVIKSIEGFGANSQLLLNVPGDGQEMEITLPTTTPKGVIFLKVTTESGQSQYRKLLVD